MRKLLLASLAALALLACPAGAQDLGNVGLRTVSATLANAATCTGSAQTFVTNQGIANFRNLGQFAHQASATSNAASFLVEIDGLDNNGSAVRISNPQVAFQNGGTASYVVQGAGYYTNIQVSVVCTNGATFSLSYTASFGTGGAITGIPQSTTFLVTGTDVQGLVPQGFQTGTINPLLIGGAGPAVNGGFVPVGLDNFNPAPIVTTVPSSLTGLLTEATVPPLLNQQQELALVFNAYGGNANTRISNIVAPWTAITNFTCNSPGGTVCAAVINNALGGGEPFQRNFQTGGAPVTHQDFTGIVAFTGSSSIAVRQGTFLTAASAAYPSNTAAGSTLVAAAVCNVTPCSGINATDTQGNKWKQLATTSVTGGIGSWATLTIWVSATLSSAAADTVTFSASSGSIFGVGVVEVSGTTPSQIVFPSTFASVDSLGNQIVKLDAQSSQILDCFVTLTTNTTTQLTNCGAPTTVNGVAVRLNITDLQINTTTAGTATTLQPQTGTGSNCATGLAPLSAILYPDTALGLQSFSFHTPWVAPLQTALCFTQAGTTAGTATIEVHGFLAP